MRRLKRKPHSLCLMPQKRGLIRLWSIRRGLSDHLMTVRIIWLFWLKDYLNGKLPACVRGGYDFVDVRDVARGCLLAAEKGRRGECYILSNRHYEISDLLRMARHTGGGRRIPVLPIWMAKAGMPILERISGTNGERALYTTYALYTLNSNDRFSHDKAARELGYHPRDLYITIRDTVKWLKRRSQQTIKEPDEK